MERSPRTHVGGPMCRRPHVAIFRAVPGDAGVGGMSAQSSVLCCSARRLLGGMLLWLQRLFDRMARSSRWMNSQSGLRPRGGGGQRALSGLVNIVGGLASEVLPRRSAAHLRWKISEHGHTPGHLRHVFQASHDSRAIGRAPFRFRTARSSEKLMVVRLSLLGSLFLAPSPSSRQQILFQGC